MAVVERGEEYVHAGGPREKRCAAGVGRGKKEKSSHFSEKRGKTLRIRGRGASPSFLRVGEKEERVI